MQHPPLVNAQIMAAVRNLAHSTQTLRPALQEVGQAAVWLDAFMQDTYDRTGQPYGDTEEGFLQWCQEEVEAMNSAQQARRQQEQTGADRYDFTALKVDATAASNSETGWEKED